MKTQAILRLPATAVTTACVLCFLAAAPNLRAQSFGRVQETQSNSDSYYYYVQPGSPTVQVFVLGMAKYAGLYEVTEGTDMKQLLALCGGPNFDRSQFLNRQKTTVRLYRPAQGQQQLLYEGMLEDAVADSGGANVLRDGDVLTIEVMERRRFDWRDLLTILNVVVLIILAIDRLQSST
jgi:protein involved in polysaccharide export with SLBB domain